MKLPSVSADRRHITHIGQLTPRTTILQEVWEYERSDISSWAICKELQEWFKDNNIDVYYDYGIMANKIIIVFASEADMALYLLRWIK